MIHLLQGACSRAADACSIPLTLGAQGELDMGVAGGDSGGIQLLRKWVFDNGFL